MEKIDYALLLLRISFGLSMAFHGYNKISSGITGTAGWFQSIGMKWPKVQAWTAALAEVLSGLALASGFLTTYAAATIISLMLVAIITVHWKVGYFIFLPNGGWEYCASITTVAASLALIGPGQISVDDALGISSSYGVVLIPIAALVAVCHLAVSYRPVRGS